MAVDLAVAFNELPADVSAGDQVTFDVRVKNNGDELAIDAAIKSEFTGLSDISWTRVGGQPSRLELDRLNGNDGFAFVATPNYRQLTSAALVGDVNGDDVDDFAVGVGRGGGASVVFGAKNIGMVANLNQDELDGKNGFMITGRGETSTTLSGGGDVNADGIDDLLVTVSDRASQRADVYVLFGRENWDQSSLQLDTLPAGLGVVIRGIEVQNRQTTNAVGDVNGDGVEDVMIRGSAGTIYVLYGARTLGQSPELLLSDFGTMHGLVVSGDVGDVAAAGDFNADGYGDLILGNQTANAREGQAWLVYGAPKLGTDGRLELATLQGENGFTIYGRPGMDAFGASVNGVGDVNGDGFDDVLIYALSGFSSRGPGSVDAILIFGRERGSSSISAADLNGSNGVIIDFGRSSEGIFSTYAPAGDINADGIDDLLIGVPDHSFHGAAYVILGSTNWGGSTRLQTESLIDEGRAFELQRQASIEFLASDGLGSFLGGKGDVNADGVDDIMVGAARGGRAYVVFGRENEHGDGNIDDRVDLEAGATLTYTVQGTVPEGVAFLSLRATATLDREPRLVPNDSVEVEVEISRPETMAGEDATYQVRIHNRERHHAVLATVRSEVTRWLKDPKWKRTGGFPAVFDLSGLESGDGFVLRGTNRQPLPVSLSETGDVNGDGFGDFLFGQFTHAGVELHIQFGQASEPRGPSRPQTVANPLLIHLPHSGIGDFNGDGLNDIIWSEARETHIKFGSSQFDIEAESDVQITGLLGVLLNGSGDINADGFDDAVIGGFINDFGAYIVAVVLGGSQISIVDVQSLNGTNGFVVNRLNVERADERSLHLGGDINGDGFADFIISEVSENLSYVIFGAKDFETDRLPVRGGLDGANGFVIRGADISREPFAPKDTVSIVGDVNADGFHDLVVAGRGPQNTSAYLIFGSPNLGLEGTLDLLAFDDSQGVSITFDQPLTVSDLGDFNGDGIDDFVLGSEQGAFVVFGDLDIGGNGKIDLGALDGSNGIQLAKKRGGVAGSLVSGAGDINADGIDDILVSGVHSLLPGGELFVIYGSDRFASGAGDFLTDTVEIAPGGTVTYAVSGIVREGSSVPLGVVVDTAFVTQSDGVQENNEATSLLPVRVEAKLAADIDLDGVISFQDFLILSANYGNDSASREQGDLDGDGVVSFTDFVILHNEFGRRV